MRKVLAVIGIAAAAIALVAAGLLVYYKFFAFVPDRGGMRSDNFCKMEVTAYNSGTDEFGERVGYGKGETKEYEVFEGDLFYEDFGDSLLRNPEKAAAEESLGLIFELRSVGRDSVILVIGAEEREIQYGEKFSMNSLIFLCDGASTSYTLEFTKD